MALAGSWVLVFAAMQLVQAQWGDAPPSSLLGPWPVGSLTSHLFGSQTWAEVRHGEYWRTVTATFLHGSLIHLGLNLLGLVQLGRLIEPWYRSGPFLALCLAIGGLGNLLSGLMRQAMISIRPWAEGSAVAKLWPGAVHHFFGGRPEGGIHTASLGGSTILLGLMGLILVVGWRSRTRMGSYLRDQMAVLLLATALLGAFMPQYIDNYGHTGGAIVGALFGLLHRPLLRMVERRPFRLFTWVLSGVLVGTCCWALVRDSTTEVALGRKLAVVNGRVQAEQMTLPYLPQFYQLYARDALRANPDTLDEWAIRDWFGIPPTAPSPGQAPEDEAAQTRAEHTAMAQILDRLDVVPVASLAPPIAEDLARLRILGRNALTRSPNYNETYEFAARAGTLIRALSEDYNESSSLLRDLSQSGKRKP